VRTTRSTGRRHGRLVAAALISLGLVAASCSDKKDDEGGGGGTEETDGGGGDTTVASTTPIVTDPPITEPPVEASYGGSIVVAGEAEVSSPWTPAAMQCDSFCQMRARTFYDPLITVDNDLNWKPYLAESIEPNADNTVFTIKIREGIKFHDGSDVNADAVMFNLNMFNLNATGSGLLVSAGVKDLARDPACWTAEGGLANLACKLVMEKVDDYTFTIATGFNGDASQPLSWPLFPYYLGGQFGLIASQQSPRSPTSRSAPARSSSRSTHPAKAASSSSSATRTTGTATPLVTSCPSSTRSSSVSSPTRQCGPRPSSRATSTSSPAPMLPW